MEQEELTVYSINCLGAICCKWILKFSENTFIVHDVMLLQ